MIESSNKLILDGGKLKEISIFIDGSCICIHGKKYCGSGIHFPNKEYTDVSINFSVYPLTNQRAELYALYIALEIIKNGNYNKIKIYSDSKYTINIFTTWIKKWKELEWKKYDGKIILNSDIIKKIDELLLLIGYDKVNLTHVKAHTKRKTYKAIGNEVADKLAKNGCFLTKT